MAEMPDDPSPQQDPLQLARCADCGYLLTGLPDRGICPECGSAYGPEMIVLYGWPAGAREWLHSNRRRRWRQAMKLLNDNWWVFYILWMWGWRPWRRGGLNVGLSDLALIMCWMSPAVIALWRRYINPPIQGPAPLQMRLAAEGFALREHIGKAKLTPWTPRHRFMLNNIKPGVCEIRIERGRSESLVLERPWDEDFVQRVRRQVEPWCPVTVQHLPQAAERTA